MSPPTSLERVPLLTTTAPHDDIQSTRGNKPGREYPDYLLSSGASVNVDNIPSNQLEFDFVISTTARLSSVPIAEKRAL
jgi:hypothetical protein